MKGKRKAKNTKFALEQKFHKEARSVLAKRAATQGSRFLDATSTFVVANEPAGLLAGSSAGKEAELR